MSDEGVHTGRADHDYNPGTRAGLIAELEAMRLQLTPSERRLERLSRSVLDKLGGMTDGEFDSLDLYPDI